MELNSRQKKILENINRYGKIKVSSTAKELFFSEMTIRRDLKIMEKEGLLRRTHGGAVENFSTFQYPVDYRMKINKNQKQHLASQASKYLKDNQVIFLNSSSTLTYILPHLMKHKNLQVITNSVHLLHYLSAVHIPCFLTGGKYNEIERCLSGRQTEEFLKDINPDIAFLSCEALSDDGYLTESDRDLAEIAKIAVKNSKTAVLLMDRSKVGTVCTYNICHTDSFDGVILF
ncbi:MAG: DeoR/GlpR transcriptional regulator [Clostridia bacterium]|nr:DeoR/GlpR transcriptional regulator [Clostridia bacterium]